MWAKIKCKNINSCYNLRYSTRKRATTDSFLFVENRFGSIYIFSKILNLWKKIRYLYLFPNVDRFLKSILFFKDCTLEINIFERTSISRWLGRENEENMVGLGNVVVGLPSLNVQCPHFHTRGCRVGVFWIWKILICRKNNF